MEFLIEFFGLAFIGFCNSEHIGIHINSPYHFSKNGRILSEIQLEYLLAIPGVFIDVYDKIQVSKWEIGCDFKLCRHTKGFDRVSTLLEARFHNLFP